ncbi:MAG: anti-sigma factor family protein [Bacillota bacterium]
MNCQEVMELMQRQLDDDLDESEREVLINHTRHCPDCAAMFERLKLLSAELTSLPKVVPSYSLVDAIMPQLERIELFGQPEAAAEASSSSITESIEVTPRRVKRDRRWPSMRVMGGVIAAGIVAGLFLVTYKLDLSPDFASSNSAANESASAMDTAAEAPQELAMKITVEDGAAASEVGTEAMDDKATDDGDLKLESRSGSSDESETTTSNSDKSTAQEAPASEQSEGGTNGIASGDGSNSSEGSTGSYGDSHELYHKELSETEKLAAEQGLLSPDGKLSAHAEDYSIQIYTMADQTLLLESPRKNGKLANLVWSEDSSQLTYEVHVEKGAIEIYVIDLVSRQEKKGAH